MKNLLVPILAAFPVMLIGATAGTSANAAGPAADKTVTLDDRNEVPIGTALKVTRRLEAVGMLSLPRYSGGGQRRGFRNVGRPGIGPLPNPPPEYRGRG